MRAVAVRPGIANSVALAAVPEPAVSEGAVLARALALGICGTDREIIAGLYGWAPPGADYLILGHESLGRVLEMPEGSGFAKCDLVAGIVRRPDPRALGTTYHNAFDDLCPDIVLECTGASPIVLDRAAPDGVICLTGVWLGQRKPPAYAAAADALAMADPKWLEGLVTRRVPLSCWQEAFERRPDDIKVVLDFTL